MNAGWRTGRSRFPPFDAAISPGSAFAAQGIEVPE